VLPTLTAIGGVAWDTINHPDNFRNPPVNTDQESDQNLGGKLGFTYQPTKKVTLRGIAAEGLGGLSFDESVRLEPAQLAGFNQAYRTVISESVAGSVEAPTYRIAGLSAEGVLGRFFQRYRAKGFAHGRRFHRLFIQCFSDRARVFRE
jgi:hypothetical protein